MRYAVLSDVHGNLEALRAVLADAREQGAATILCLGDLVGYGADPVPCVEEVARHAAAVVAGNHEHGALGLLRLDWFNPTAGAAVAWTARHLPADVRRYLDALPLTATVGDACLAHASPREPGEWDYLTEPPDGFEALKGFDTRLGFVGHSHRPAVWSVGSSGPEFGAAFRAWPVEVPLRPGRRYLVNVGSVGQPRDRDPRAAWALWDVDGERVSIRRVAYDHQAAAARILAAGLPRPLAERLALGR